jgi:hypothetical protein
VFILLLCNLLDAVFQFALGPHEIDSQLLPIISRRGGEGEDAMPCHAVVSWVSSAERCAKVSSPICHSGILFAGGLAWPHSGTAEREGRRDLRDGPGRGPAAVALPNSRNLIWKSSRRDPPRARSPTIREKTLQPTQAQLSSAPERVRERLAGGGGGGTPLLLISPLGRTGWAAADPSC